MGKITKLAVLTVFGLIVTVHIGIAQTSLDRRVERGNATQEMQTEGLSAAHSRLPVGSRVRVTNPANNQDIEVTIIGQIPASSRRIIDLSPGAAAALGLRSGGQVMVTTLGQDTAPTAGTEIDRSAPPFSVTINNYIINPEQAQPEEVKEEPRMASQPAPVQPEPAAQPAPVQVAEAPPAPPPEPPPPPPVPDPVQEDPKAKPLYDRPPVFNVQIIPDRLPDPGSSKIYRLMVGVYNGVDNAFPVYQQLRAAGFQVMQEQAGDMCRVFAANIPASMVYHAAQRLGAIGFEQVWIQE